MPVDLPSRPLNQPSHRVDFSLDGLGRWINRHALPLFWTAYFTVVICVYTLLLTA